jgi:DNA-binding CsgD family transcriptional regulator
MGYRFGVAVPVFTERKCLGFYSVMFQSSYNWDDCESRQMLLIGHLLGAIIKRAQIENTLPPIIAYRQYDHLLDDICSNLLLRLRGNCACRMPVEIQASGEGASDAISTRKGKALREPRARATIRLPEQEALEGRAGGRMSFPHAGDGADAKLTEREIEVLQGVVDGLTNKAISKRLYISEATVKRHLAHLIQKTQSRNRAHLAALALRSGYAQ